MSVEKRSTFEHLLSMPTITRIRVNATADGVVVPEHLKYDGALPLNLSYRFGTRLEVKDDGIYADLSFGGRSFDVVIPWAAVWLMEKQDGQGQAMWREDMPQSVRDHYDEALRFYQQEAEAERIKSEREAAERTARIRKSNLKPV